MIIPKGDDMVIVYRPDGRCPVCFERVGQILLKWPGCRSGRKWFSVEERDAEYQVHGCHYKREAAA